MRRPCTGAPVEHRDQLSGTDGAGPAGAAGRQPAIVLLPGTLGTPPPARSVRESLARRHLLHQRAGIAAKCAAAAVM